MGDKVSLSVGDTTKDYPVLDGAIGPQVIDIRKLYADTGMFTYDPGFTSTASCESKITYIDGDEGVLLHRGFPIEQQVVASLALKAQSDQTLATPAAQARLTGDYATLYQTAIDQMDAAGPEEKATGQWAKDRAALVEGRKQAIARPGLAPAGIQNDSVAAYMKETGSVVAGAKTRDFGKVATDVRTVLDKQYATAKGDGAATSPDGGDIDFSRFDTRSLAAISLNRDGQFSDHEVTQAANEIRARDHQSVMTSYKSSAGADPSDFGKAILTRYADMTSEEREASGWTPALYDKMVALQNLSEKLSSLFNSDGGVNTGGTSLLDYI